MIQDILDKLGIEYRDKERYTTCCPKCSKDRKKHSSKSLQVFITEKGASVKCFHSGQCEWNKPHFVTENSQEELNIKETEVKFVPFPSEDIELPIDSQGGKWVYKDSKGNTILIIIRVNLKDGTKLYYPVAYGDDGFIYLRRPTNIKLLYRSEYLDPTKQRPVIVVEGEKTAEAAAQIFKKADVVTWPGGSNNVAQGHWDLLKNRKVYLWPDADEPGRQAMQQIADLLVTNNIYIVDTNNLTPKTDLADNIDIEVIKELFKTANKYEADFIPGEMLPSTLQNLHSKDVKYIPFGWEFMDKFIKIPQGVVVISGRTNHGKTAFMINTALNIALNTDKTVLYLTLEFPVEELNLRMVKTLDGTTQGSSGWEDDIYFNDALRDLNIPAAKDYYNLLTSRKLRVADSSASIRDITKIMDKCKELNKDLIIFVDYLQIIPIHEAGYNKARYEKLKDMIELLRLRANVNRQVLVGGSQLTAGETPYLDSVRESKDLENTAALHLKVWNKLKGKEKEISMYEDIPGQFVVHVEKSRQNGANGRSFGFNFSNGCKLVPAFDEKGRSF